MTMHDSNKFMTFTTTLKCCIQTMKNRTDEANDYERNIRNDLFCLLEEIKIKMHRQVRAKCKFTQIEENNDDNCPSLESKVHYNKFSIDSDNKNYPDYDFEPSNDDVDKEELEELDFK